MSPAAFVTVLAAASHPDVTVLRFAFQATSVPTIPQANRILWIHRPGHGDARNHDGV